ncbi:MAG: arylsulfatase [Planctomycetota bacterium]|jgi:arylsulfatase
MLRARNLLAALAFLLPAIGRAAADGDAAPRPNIIVILADDLGYSDIGCYGSEIETPNLDRLAANGLRFTQFYNTARCCPTRASLLTGLYPHQAGVGHMMGDRGTDGYRGDLNDRCATIPEVLGPAGYRCYMSGKWHVTKQVGAWSGRKELASRHNWPLQRGFDRFYGTIHGAGSFWNPVSLTDGNTPITIPEGEPYYYTDAISEKAARFVLEHHGDDPFFMYVAYTAPHWPLHAWPEDIARYADRYDDGWDAIRAERHARMIDMNLVSADWPLSPRDAGIPDWDAARAPAWQRRAMAVYAAMVDRMDQGIGRVLDALERTGRLENTLVLFAADNGGCAEGGRSFDDAGGRGGLSRMFKETRDGKPIEFGHYATKMPGPADTYQEYGKPWANASNTPFRLYKHYVHEGGIATPLIVHWPAGIESRGALRHQPGHVVDLMATFVDVAGATYPATRNDVPITPAAGLSLVPAFADHALEREAIYWEHEGNRAIRVGDWKLVARGRKGTWELYDLATDRTEVNDLAAAHPARVESMAEAWTTWATASNVLPWPK